MVAQAAATAEAALKTDLHGDLKKALASVKPKVRQDVFWLACTTWLSLGVAGLPDNETACCFKPITAGASK